MQYRFLLKNIEKSLKIILKKFISYATRKNRWNSTTKNEISFKYKKDFMDNIANALERIPGRNYVSEHINN